MSEIVLKTTNLRKSFKKNEVLKDINLEIKKGTIYGFLGKNGAGKTTTIKCLLGLFRPSKGYCHVLGSNSIDLDENIKSKIGYIPQNNELIKWMNVGQLLNYTKVFYSAWDDKLSDMLLDRFELGKKENVNKLSPGKAQALAVVITLSFKPEILVLDEPIAALDPESRRNFFKTIGEITAENGITILISSHITSDIERMVDTVGIIKDGVIKFENSIDNLKETVKRAHIVPQSNGKLPEANGISNCLNYEVVDKMGIALLKDYDQNLKGEIEKKYKVKMTLFDLNLEEIFLALHKGE